MALTSIERATATPEEMSRPTYYQIVDQAFQSERTRFISNGRPEHAAYLMEKFFAEAKSSVCLFSGHLSRVVGGVEVYSSKEVINAAKSFLRRSGSKLDIILAGDIDVDEGESAEDHPLLKGLLHERDWGFLRGRATLSRVHDDFANLSHFLVMDNTVCRVETAKREETVEAVVAFRHAEICSLASRLFRRLRKSAQPFQLAIQ